LIFGFKSFSDIFFDITNEWKNKFHNIHCIIFLDRKITKIGFSMHLLIWRVLAEIV